MDGKLLTMNHTIKLYICCALTKASAALKARVESLKELIRLEHPDWEVLVFFGLGPSPSDGQVFSFDVGQTESADLIVVIADEDTWGGGIEVGVSLKNGKRMLFLAADTWTRTRMITGLCDAYPKQAMFVRYQTDGIPFAVQAIKVVAAAIERFALRDPVAAKDRAEVALALHNLSPKAREYLRTVLPDFELIIDPAESLDDVRKHNPAFEHEAFATHPGAFSTDSPRFPMGH